MSDRETKTNPSIHYRMVLKSRTPENPADVEKYKLFQDEAGQWFHPAGCQDSLVSTDVKEIVAFLKGMCLTRGFCIVYGINRSTGTVMEIWKMGRFCQRDVKALLPMGFDEWSFSWAWAPDNFQTPEGKVVQVGRRIDLSPAQTVVEQVRWAKAFGVV